MTIINAAALSNGFTMPRYRLIYEEEVHAKVNYWDLLSEKTRFITLPLWVVWMCFGFTYYGIILFTGRMYDKDGDDDGKPALSSSHCLIAHLLQGDDSKCSFDYSSLFINSASELVGCALGALVLDHLGRTKMQTYFYLLAGFAALFMGYAGLGSTGLLMLSVTARMAVMCASVRLLR